MNNKIISFINKSISHDKEVFVGIFNEIITNFKDETKRQHAIRAVIMKFEHDFPKLMEEFDAEIRKKKELSKNKHSADYENQIRQTFAIPDGLETRLTQVLNKIGEEYRFLSDEAQKEFKEQDWFRKNFKRYSVPEVY